MNDMVLILEGAHRTIDMHLLGPTQVQVAVMKRPDVAVGKGEYRWSEQRLDVARFRGLRRGARNHRKRTRNDRLLQASTVASVAIRRCRDRGDDAGTANQRGERHAQTVLCHCPLLK
jgi:hypothetical protein